MASKFHDLDGLVKNLEKTFRNKELFTQDEEDPNTMYVCDTELEFPICEILIDFSRMGNCNWDAIEYLSKRGYFVYAGERDSFGWLTGVIEPHPITKEVVGLEEDKKYIIIYG